MHRRPLRHRASEQEVPQPRGEQLTVCSALEQAAAESGLPVDFLVRVIWQESRFNALAVSAKGAQGAIHAGHRRMARTQ
jgi:soluble lytic murein transglycosylase-like protein